MKSLRLALVTLIALIGIKCDIGDKFGNFYKCGFYQNPTSTDDCFPANLDTGFTCCYVTNIADGSGNTCALVSHAARSLVEDPEVIGATFDCGAPISGSYIKLSFSLLALLFYGLL